MKAPRRSAAESFLHLVFYTLFFGLLRWLEIEAAFLTWLDFGPEVGRWIILTLSTAKYQLGRLLDRVLKKGEPVVIRRGKRFVLLSEYVVPEPIPQRPAGYFTVPLTPAEYERANRLTALSPDRPEFAGSGKLG